MSFWWQVVCFAVPGAVVYTGVFYGVPKLVDRGWALIYAFWLCLWLPALLLLPAALVLFSLTEGGAFTAEVLRERFRFFPLAGTDWLWIAGAVFLTLLTEQVLEPVSRRLAKFGRLSPPHYLPAPFHPLRKFSLPPTEFFGVPLPGNWKLLFLFVPVHVFAMFSEEVMWRGLLLPIQEAHFGGTAWIVNGLMWAWLMHAALKWHFVAMIPGMLIAPLTAQYLGSTWASFSVHAISNAPLWFILLLGIRARPQSDRDTETSRQSQGSLH